MRHSASATSAGGASIDPRRCRDRKAVVTVCICTNSKCGWCWYVSGTGGPIKSIAPSYSSIKIGTSAGISSRIVVGGYNSGENRLNTEIQCAVLWARRGKNFTSGCIAPSNSSIKTRSSTDLPGRIFVGGYSNEGNRLNTEIRCVIVWPRHGKKITSGSIARGHPTRTSEVGQQRNTRQKNSLKYSLIWPRSR